MTNSVAYEAVEPVLKKLGWTWCDSQGERAWTRYAWGVLGEGGFTATDAEDSHDEVIVRAVALWALTKVFYAKAFDEGQEEEWQYSVDVAVDKPPFIAKSWLEEQVRDQYDLSPEPEESDDPEEEYEEDVPPELANEVLVTLVRDAAVEVGAQLRKTLGEELFAALMSSTSGEVTYPLDEDTLADALDGSSWGAAEAYSWVSGDLSI